MSESSSASPPLPLVIPASVQAVIDEFEQRTDAFTAHDVSSALNAARMKLENPSVEQNHGAWAEVLAFALAAGTEHNEKPWGGYFGPMGSWQRDDGEIVYSPDVRQADARILSHWKERARNLKSPVLSARYNDLVWDLSKLIANDNRKIDFAYRAIDAYVAAARQNGRDAYYAFPDAKRALALAIQIDDKARRDLARNALLDLHKKAVLHHALWWEAYDALEEQPKAGLSNAEKGALITDMEQILARVSDTTDPKKFDPHAVESVGNRLIAHYRRQGDLASAQRLNLSIARAFEHFGSLADPMLASMVLQTSMDAYNAAGAVADANRILSLIEQANVDSVAQMTRHGHSVEIPPEEVEKFLAQIVVDSKDETFHRIAGEFLLSRGQVEESLQETIKTSPLVAMIGRTKLSGNRVVASIGSITDDPVGRLVDEAASYLGMNTAPLGWAIDRAVKQHTLSAEDFASFCNRTGLFGDGTLLLEGLSAWKADDNIKAAHVLIPQIENGFRTLAGRGGRPTTKAHQLMKQARVVVTFGEMLTPETAAVLGVHGPDIVLHFRALYADPRGYNFRNDLAHGLSSHQSIHAGIMLWVIHSLVLLGAWMRPQTLPSIDPLDGNAPRAATETA